MRIRPFRGHPLFCANRGLPFLGSCWDFQLRKGEDTRHRLQSTSAEVYFILAGGGRMTVAGRTSPVHSGEMIFVPPFVDHVLANLECPLLSGVSVEVSSPAPAASPESSEGSVEAERWESPLRLDEVIDALPDTIREAEAIQAIVRLFDLGGVLSEQIEKALGLDNDLGQSALAGLETKLMSAVVEIADRYRTNGVGDGPRRRWG